MLPLGKSLCRAKFPPDGDYGGLRGGHLAIGVFMDDFGRKSFVLPPLVWKGNCK